MLPDNSKSGLHDVLKDYVLHIAYFSQIMTLCCFVVNTDVEQRQAEREAYDCVVVFKGGTNEGNQ